MPRTSTKSAKTEVKSTATEKVKEKVSKTKTETKKVAKTTEAKPVEKPVETTKTTAEKTKFLVVYATEQNKIFYREFDKKADAFKFYYFAKNNKTGKLTSVRLISV